MSDCGLTNLAVCLPEKFFEYIVTIVNAPLEALLRLVKNLLSEPVNVSLFHSFWAIIIYIISIFYGLFFLFAGFNFMISGYNAEKRENAKVWMRNVVLMVLFVQASYIIYSLIIELNSLLTIGVINMIDPNFFLLSVDNFASIGMQLMNYTLYLIVLVITSVLLGMRYLFVSIGVVLFPFAMFFYFIPPLQTYGKMILNVLLVGIFVTFFCSIILFGASMLSTLAVFQNFKIILATMAFLSIDGLMIFLIIFALIKSAFAILHSDVGKTVVSAVKYLV